MTHPSFSQSAKPTILLVISSLTGRGGERSVLTLAQGFYDVGCTVHLLVFSQQQDYELSPDVMYHHIDAKHWRYTRLTREAKYKALGKAFDKYVHEHIGHCDLILANLIAQHRILHHSRLPHIAYVIRNTLSLEYKQAIAKQPKKIINRFNRIYRKRPCVCVSLGVEQDLHATLDGAGSIGETVTIYNPFDQVLMQQMAKAYHPKDKLGLDDYIVHIGTFSHAKAHDVLLKAYAKSSKQYPLVLLGKGKLMAQMKQLAADLGILDQVIFFGFDANPYPFIKHAKGLVLSSRFEGFVRVVGEALALNTPAISTDCPSGPNEMLPDNNLVAVDDVDALALKMTALMANPDGFRVPFDEALLPENIAMQYLDYFGFVKT